MMVIPFMLYIEESGESCTVGERVLHATNVAMA
jgi:hypothetical protein